MLPQFEMDKVSVIIKASLDTMIGGNIYEKWLVDGWTEQAVESVLGSLTKNDNTFKYIVTCVIMQKRGYGADLHTASSCSWDNPTDAYGSCIVRWENETMYCSVSVHGLRHECKRQLSAS